MNILFDLLSTRDFPNDVWTAWERAAHESELSDPLCNEPEWSLSYHDTHGKKRPVLMLADHGNFFCLAEESMVNGTVLLVPLESSWLYARPFLGQDPIPLFLKAVDLLEEHYGPTHVPAVVLGGMRPHHPMSNEVLLNLGHVFHFFRYSEGVQCAASLTGGMDGFLGRRSANFRAKLKKAVRLAKDAGIVYQRFAPRTPEQAAQIYARMLNVEKYSWKGREGNGLLLPNSTNFYLRLLHNLTTRGKARVIMASRDGEDLGFIFGGVSHGIYRGQQFSYHLDYARASIGNTLQYEQLLWLCEEGVHRYDLGPISGDKMAYKGHWAELTFPLQSWVLKHAASQ